MKMFVLSLIVSAVVLSTVGCVSSPKVEKVKLGDNELSCKELVTQIEEADSFKKTGEGNKSVNKDNVIAGVFFFPALVSTYLDANDAIKAAEDRKANLTQIYNEKKCSGKTKV